MLLLEMARRAINTLGEYLMATTIWTLLSVFLIAPLGAIAFDRSHFGNWIWHIDREKVRGNG